MLSSSFHLTLYSLELQRRKHSLAKTSAVSQSQKEKWEPCLVLDLMTSEESDDEDSDNSDSENLP